MSGLDIQKHLFMNNVVKQKIIRRIDEGQTSETSMFISFFYVGGQLKFFFATIRIILGLD